MTGHGWTDGAEEHAAPEAESGGLDQAIQARIGEQLRAMYDVLMDQPIPDRFHALLARLGTAEGAGE